MSDLESRPKCNWKPSNRFRRAQGLATDSESDFDEFTAAQKPDHDEDDKNNEDDNNIHDPASSVISSPVRSTSSIPVPLYLQCTLSTASLASTTGTLAVEDRNDGRRPKFDERFKTATLTEEEVLRMFSLFPMCFIFFLITLKRSKLQHGPLPYTHISACHLPSVPRRELSPTFTPALRA